MFDKKDFEGMPYNPLVAERDMLDVYPRLRRIEAFSESVELHSGSTSMPTVAVTPKDLDLAVRFVVLYVEPRNNPIAKERDLPSRADIAWDMLGVKRSERLRDFQSKGHWWFNMLVFEYFKLTYDARYQRWFALKSAFHTYTRLLSSNTDSALAESDVSTRAKVRKDLKEVADEVEELEAIIFKDDFLKSEISVDSFFPNRLPEVFALDWGTKQRRSL